MTSLSPHDLSGPKMSPQSARQWAAFMHLSLYAFFVLNIFGFIIPLVLWILKREESEYVDAHGKAILNFILSLVVYGVIYTVLVLVLGGSSLFSDSSSGMFGTLALAVVGALCLLLILFFFPLLGLRATSRGEGFRYPLTIHWVGASHLN